MLLGVLFHPLLLAAVIGHRPFCLYLKKLEMDTEHDAMFDGLRTVILRAIPQNFTKSAMVNNGETAASDGR